MIDTDNCVYCHQHEQDGQIQDVHDDQHRQQTADETVGHIHNDHRMFAIVPVGPRAGEGMTSRRVTMDTVACADSAIASSAFDQPRI